MRPEEEQAFIVLGSVDLEAESAGEGREPSQQRGLCKTSKELILELLQQFGGLLVREGVLSSGSQQSLQPKFRLPHIARGSSAFKMLARDFEQRSRMAIFGKFGRQAVPLVGFGRIVQWRIGISYRQAKAMKLSSTPACAARRNHGTASAGEER
jgi:hypothetical protein